MVSLIAKDSYYRIRHLGSKPYLHKKNQPMSPEADLQPTQGVQTTNLEGSNELPLQQNVFLVTKISEEIFFVTKNTVLVTKYEFRH